MLIFPNVKEPTTRPLEVVIRQALDEILPTIPPEHRAKVVAQLVAHVYKREHDSQWVNQQVQDMLNVPSIVYKYLPCSRLEE